MLNKADEKLTQSLSVTLPNLDMIREDPIEGSFSHAVDEFAKKQQSILAAKQTFSQRAKRKAVTPGNEGNNKAAFITRRNIFSQPTSLNSPATQEESSFVDFDSAMNSFKEKLRARDFQSKNRSKYQQACSLTNIQQESDEPQAVTPTNKVASLSTLSLNRISCTDLDDIESTEISPVSTTLKQSDKESLHSNVDVKPILKASSKEGVLEPDNEMCRRKQKSPSMKMVRFTITEKKHEQN